MTGLEKMPTVQSLSLSHRRIMARIIRWLAYIFREHWKKMRGMQVRGVFLSSGLEIIRQKESVLLQGIYIHA